MTRVLLLLLQLASPTTSDRGVVASGALHTSRPYLQQQRRRQVRWMVDAGRAKQGVQPWATHVASQGAITGLVGCCGRFHIDPNGTWFDEWPEAKYPLSNWDFAHDLGLTMHFVFTVDQPALINQTALLAIPDAVAAAVASNFTGYSLDYETAPAGPWGSAAFRAEVDGLLLFVTRLAAALKEVGKELLVDVGGTTAASLGTQGCSMNQSAICAAQKTLVQRWTRSGVSSLVEMGSYYGTDLGFNRVVLEQPLQGGVPATMLSSGIGTTTTAGCGCGTGSGGVLPRANRSCCAPNACCGPAQSVWAHQPPYAPVPACVGAPCGNCKVLGTHLPCYNWTATSCEWPYSPFGGEYFALIYHVHACVVNAWVGWLEQNQIDQISLFMSTMDGVDSPATEGNQFRKMRMMIAFIHCNESLLVDLEKSRQFEKAHVGVVWDSSSSIFFFYWPGRNATSPFFYEALRKFLDPHRVS